MAICFGCWKLVKIDDVNPKKSFHYSRQRYVDYLEPSDLMVNHWNHECDKPQTLDGHARIIQTAFRNFRQRPNSLANQVWNTVNNDNTPIEKKYSGVVPQKMKNSMTRQQFDLRLAKEIAEYNKYPNRYGLPEREYKKYYYPFDWIGSKKNQFRDRLRNHVINLLQQNGYRIINGRQWFEMLKWSQNPDQYLNNGCRDIVRI